MSYPKLNSIKYSGKTDTLIQTFPSKIRSKGSGSLPLKVQSLYKLIIRIHSNFIEIRFHIEMSKNEKSNPVLFDFFEKILPPRWDTRLKRKNILAKVKSEITTSSLVAPKEWYMEKVVVELLRLYI